MQLLLLPLELDELLEDELDELELLLEELLLDDELLDELEPGSPCSQSRTYSQSALLPGTLFVHHRAL